MLSSSASLASKYPGLNIRAWALLTLTPATNVGGGVVAVAKGSGFSNAVSTGSFTNNLNFSPAMADTTCLVEFTPLPGAGSGTITASGAITTGTLGLNISGTATAAAALVVVYGP